AVSGAAPTRETIVPKTMANLATPGRRGRGPWGDHVRSLARRPVARAGRNRPGAGARAPRGGGPRLRSLRRKRYGPPCGDGSALRPAGRCAADDRSEERRVGKEWRSRWEPQHEESRRPETRRRGGW